MGHRVKDTASDFKKPLVIAYYTVDYVKNVKGTNYWRNRILKVSTYSRFQFTIHFIHKWAGRIILKEFFGKDSDRTATNLY